MKESLYLHETWKLTEQWQPFERCHIAQLVQTIEKNSCHNPRRDHLPISLKAQTPLSLLNGAFLSDYVVTEAGFISI